MDNKKTSDDKQESRKVKVTLPDEERGYIPPPPPPLPKPIPPKKKGDKK
jgi:hypothetical protein